MISRTHQNTIHTIAKRSITLPERITLAIILMVSAWLLHDNDVLWRWNNLIYDNQLNVWSRPANDDIIIVAIDDDSLQQLGRWPWPRSTHAKIIDIINRQNPRAISLDIIFAEPDQTNPYSDVLLSRSMQTHGNVVLPVYMSQGSAHKQAIEALPIPEFTEHAATLGHVHVELDRDGIARRVFLYEGIGTAYWPHLSLAILGHTPNPPSQQQTSQSSGSPGINWQRAQPRLIPYAGPPGHFNRISYAQVLNGEFNTETFKDKYVLVGTTAFGLGDALPTPVSRQSHSMPGVELNANILDAQIKQLSITPAPALATLLFTLLFAALPVLLYPHLVPRATLLAALMLFAAILFFTAVLLWLLHIWLPPAVALLMVVISYPLWSWRRLEHAMRFLNAELQRLDSQRKQFAISASPQLQAAMQFIAELLPIHGWKLQDKNGNIILQHGTPPKKTRGKIKRGRWNMFQFDCWAFLNYEGNDCLLGVSLKVDTELGTQERRLLDNFLQQHQHDSSKNQRLESDILQARIQQVQLAGAQLSELRRFVDDGMSNMSDGVIVADNCGHVLLNNSRASWYLQADDAANLQRYSILECLQHTIMPGGGQWQPVLHKTILHNERFMTQARHRDGRDLLIQISPLHVSTAGPDGIIVNLSDIQLLKASERKRDEMLSFLSHDIRSPLASMMALIEIAHNKPNDELLPLLDRMQVYTEKTLHMAEQFLQLSRVKSSEELPFHDMDFNVIALNAIEQMWLAAEQKNISLTHEFKQESVWIMGEPDLLERAIINLISNALKYGNENTNVHVQTTIENEFITCSVQDEGPGIAEQDMPNLFELFKRVQRNGEQRKSGIGLGLAFVDAVSQRHNGYVEVESVTGQGSTFILHIPLHQN